MEARPNKRLRRTERVVPNASGHKGGQLGVPVQGEDGLLPLERVVVERSNATNDGEGARASSSKRVQRPMGGEPEDSSNGGDTDQDMGGTEGGPHTMVAHPELAATQTSSLDEGDTGMGVGSNEGGTTASGSTLPKGVWAYSYRSGVGVLGKVPPIDPRLRERELIERDDWKLNENLFKFLDDLWGPHKFDRFASDENHQLPFYNTVNNCAFNQPWNYEKQGDDCYNNWMNPPWELLHLVIQKIMREKAKATVIMPKEDMRRMRLDEYPWIELPRTCVTFSKKGQFYYKPPFSTVAVRIDKQWDQETDRVRR